MVATEAFTTRARSIKHQPYHTEITPAKKQHPKPQPRPGGRARSPTDSDEANPPFVLIETNAGERKERFSHLGAAAAVAGSREGEERRGDAGGGGSEELVSGMGGRSARAEDIFIAGGARGIADLGGG